jgi:hypothetical protein
MTIQDLYDWAKERNLTDKQIAKNINLQIEHIESVYYLAEEYTKSQPMVVLD